MPIRLIGFDGEMAEGLCAHVKGYCGEVGQDGGNVLFDNIHKTVYCVGRKTARGSKRAYTVECTVKYAVSVKNDKIHPNLSLRKAVTPFSVFAPITPLAAAFISAAALATA